MDDVPRWLRISVLVGAAALGVAFLLQFLAQMMLANWTGDRILVNGAALLQSLAAFLIPGALLVAGALAPWPLWARLTAWVGAAVALSF